MRERAVGTGINAEFRGDEGDAGRESSRVCKTRSSTGYHRFEMVGTGERSISKRDVVVTTIFILVSG